jgi:hypothetical protein
VNILATKTVVATQLGRRTQNGDLVENVSNSFDYISVVYAENLQKMRQHALVSSGKYHCTHLNRYSDGLRAGLRRNRGSVRGKGKSHSVQTGCGANPASYPMGTGGRFPGTTHPHLVPRIRMIKLYLHSPIHRL